MEENKQLQLLDVLGIPIYSPNKNNQGNIIFNHREKILIYTLGSNIIHYNIKKDSKTFLQYFSSNISYIKFINDLENILLIITNSSFPILSIWQIPSFRGLYSQEIITHQNFEVNNIFIEQLNPITYLILIINKNNNSDNFLYSLNILKNGKYDLKLFGKLKFVITQINGFSIFYNSNDLVFLMKHNLQYYSINMENEKCIMKKNLNFSFKLKENSLRISKIINILSVLTDKGNCLIYDQNGIDKSTINPLGQECFTTNEFFGDSLCLGTSHGNIYVYNINGFKLNYMINYNDFSNIKNLSLINKNNINGKINIYNYSSDNEIIFISLNERLDQIFILFRENSFVFMSIEQLLNKEKYNYNINSLKINNIIFYSFNHSKKILDICMNAKNKNNFNDNNIFYTCSKDNKLIKYYIDQNSDKLKNQYYDLDHIISTSKQKNNTKNYFTILKTHPSFRNKLFAGDNKGFLYIINLCMDSNNSILKYRKYNIGSYEIIFLNFSHNGNLLCIGFETGYQLIYKTNKIFECVLKLNDHYLNFENIEYRKSNNHILTYCSFLNNRRSKHCIIYTKGHNIIEYAKLYKSEDGFYLTKKKIMEITINNTILDLVLHQSEIYVIILNDKKQILINNILINQTTAVIDLNSQIKKIYNIQIDISGLYLGIICDLNKKDNINQENNIDIQKNDLIIIEISTTKVKNYIIQMNSISKIIFDNFGKYIIIGGESGDISLWRLPGEISSSIKKILNEIEFDVNFWEKYEIKYNNHKEKDSSLFSLNDSEKNNSLDDINSNSNYSNNNIINNNIYRNYNTNSNNRKNNMEFQNIKNINRIKSMTKKHRYKKSHLNDLPKIKNENNLEKKLFKSHNFFENNYTDNGINNKLRNKSYKFLNNNNYISQKLKNKDNYYLRDYLLKNSQLCKKNNKIYEFWSQKDTINIKKSINMNENYKHPEPIDIDDDL